MPVGLNRSLPSSSKTEIQKKVMLIWTSKEDSKWPVTMADMYQPLNNKTLQLNMSFFSPTCQSKKWLDQVNVWAVFIITLVSFGRMYREDFPGLYGPLFSFHFPTVLPMPFHPITGEVVFREKTKCMLPWRQSKSLRREQWKQIDRMRPWGAGSRLLWVSWLNEPNM